MGRCRLCDTEVKGSQIYCPKCGAKLPLLDKGEFDDFKNFKKRIKRIIFPIWVLLLILFPLFIIKIPVTETVPYQVEELTPELKPVETPLGCAEEDFKYLISYEKPQVFANILEIKCNIENLEDEQGTFEYTAIISYKLSLEEKQKTSKLLLNSYENKTASIFFEEVEYPDQVDYICKVKPPKREVCQTKKENVLVTEKKVQTKTKQEKIYKSLFEILLEKF